MLQGWAGGGAGVQGQGLDNTGTGRAKEHSCHRPHVGISGTPRDGKGDRGGQLVSDLSG